MKRFQGKTAFITGGSGGIGRAVAERLADEGAKVVVSDRDESLARDTAEAIGPAATYDVCDVRDPEAVAEAIGKAATALGQLDILVNCAGVANIETSIDISAEQWRRVHEINLDGTFFASRSFARLRAGGPGAIVNLASVAGLLAIPDRPAYISSKHAVVGLTREMSMEFAPQGLRVNAVAPGIIRTPMSEAHFQDPVRAERIAKAHPMGRGGYANEVAAAIAFLCSEDASFITGAILPVDGGYSAGKAW